MSAVEEKTPTREPGLADLLSPPRGDGDLGRLDGYRVLGVLGGGGSGLVLDAEDARGRRVALKVLRPRHDTPESRQRFGREAAVAVTVKDPRVLPLLGRGLVKGTPYLVLPRLQGQSLEARLRHEGPLPLGLALRVARQTAGALAAVHAAGFVHRDVKPANLWLEAGSDGVKLLDFSLARSVTEPTRPLSDNVTQYGATLGTPGYMAPEQIGGSDVDGRADLFSLGCVLYRMVTGAAPFTGRGTGEVLRRTMGAEPPPPRQLNKRVPHALDALIRRLLAKDPADRPESARAVADELRRLERTPAGGRWRRRALGLGVGLAALAVAALLWWLRGW